MSEERKPLPLGEKLKNFANFSWDILNYINENGVDSLMVSDKVYAQRYKICEGCEHFLKRRQECLECGCYIPQKARVILDSCPLDKWTAHRESWEDQIQKISEKLDKKKESE